MSRFVEELEFVQAIGNPEYLLFLLQTHEKDDSFWTFLRQLRNTWSRPQYRRFISFPLGLYLLDLLLEDPEEAIRKRPEIFRDPVSVLRLVKAQVDAQAEYDWQRQLQ